MPERRQLNSAAVVMGDQHDGWQLHCRAVQCAIVARSNRRALRERFPRGIALTRGGRTE